MIKNTVNNAKDISALTQQNLRVLCTGVSGFVASHIFEHIMKNTNWTVVGMYRNNIAGNLKRIDEILENHPEWESRAELFRFDLRDEINELVASQIGDIDIILHVAASSHVDRSITDPKSFALDNTMGTIHLLDYARQYQKNLKLFVYFSTDEVYGNALGDIKHSEEYPHRPRNPYAASKAAAEDFCYSYHITYRIPLIITNTMNIIGERQHPEKYVPLIINKCLNGDKLLIHSDPTKTQPGQRHYLHARNAAAGLLFVVDNGTIGERYNIVGEVELDNLALAKKISGIVGEELNYELVDFHSSRPGHDLRYALDGTKLANMGYKHPMSFEDSLKKTVEWTLKRRQDWLIVKK